MEDDFYKQTTSPEPAPEDKSKEPPHFPKSIGPYKVESLLEKGGMSILYLGSHPETKEPTTIKVLSPHYMSHPEVIQRFQNEAEIIAMADHPNIVKLYGYGEWEGGLYIAMEFIQGISLRQYLLQTPISLKRALEIIIDVAYALCHLHTHGVIHRDLKPENILVTESGAIKVIDFGIAQLLTQEAQKDLHGRQRLIGTPIYMSPEQRQDPETVSFPSDIYSLGIIAYELILGKLSHGQIHLSLMPKGMKPILSKALQPDPNNRYQDIVDFIADISNYLNSTELIRDKQAGDRLSELSENLHRAQAVLFPFQTPNWPHFEIGIATQKSVAVSSAYHGFYELPDNAFAVMMGESSAKDAEGFIYTSVFRGMIHTLSRFVRRPSELASMLNDLLLKDNLDQVFTLTYIIFLPGENRCLYTCCGYSNLWYISKGAKTPTHLTIDNIALGIDPEAKFAEAEIPWQVGDSLVLSNFAGMLSHFDQKETFAEVNFREVVAEFIDFPPQKQADAIFRKAKITSKTIQDKAVCILSIQRSES